MVVEIITFILNNFISLVFITSFTIVGGIILVRSYKEQYVEKADIDIDFTHNGDFQLHGVNDVNNIDEQTANINEEYDIIDGDISPKEHQAITFIIKQKLKLNDNDPAFKKKYQQYIKDYEHVKYELSATRIRIQQQYQHNNQSRLDTKMIQFIDKAFEDFNEFSFITARELIEEIRLLEVHNTQQPDNDIAIKLQQADYHSLKAHIALLAFDNNLAYEDYVNFYKEIESNIDAVYMSQSIRAQQLKSLNYAVGLFIDDENHHHKIKKYVEVACQHATKYFEHGYPDAMEAVNNLSIFYQTQKQYDAASELYEQTMKANIDLLGNEHPNTLTSINNLGYAYQSQKRYAEAHLLYKEALEVKSRVLGRDHPSTLIAINNLGRLYQAQGLLAEASPLYEEALEKSTEVLGRDHPETLTTINNLAHLYQESGDLEKSDELYQEALKTRMDILGENHELTLLSVNNLAVLYYSRNDYVTAQSLLNKALKGFKKVLKPDHEYIETVQQNIILLKKHKKTGKNIALNFIDD